MADHRSARIRYPDGVTTQASGPASRIVMYHGAIIDDGCEAMSGAFNRERSAPHDRWGARRAFGI